MSARDDHAARVMARVSEPQCWAALFNEIDSLRALLHVQEQRQHLAQIRHDSLTAVDLSASDGAP